MGKNRDYAEKELTPILIGGTGRSGTSILKKVLSAHPQVSSVPTEIRVIIDPGGAVELYHALTDNWSPYVADTALQRFIMLLEQVESSSLPRKALAVSMRRVGMTPPRYSILQIGQQLGRDWYRACRQAFVESLVTDISQASWAGSRPWQVSPQIYEVPHHDPEDAARKIRQFFHSLYNQHDACTHWVEDTPFNILHARDLRALFPNLRLIHIYRDFRDVLASYQGKNWGRGDLGTIAKRICRVVQRWQQVKRELPAEMVLEVALEDLVTDPEAWGERLLAFAELPADRAFAEALALLDHGGLHRGRWKKGIPDDRKAEVSAVLRPILDDYGYGTE